MDLTKRIFTEDVADEMSKLSKKELYHLLIYSIDISDKYDDLTISMKNMLPYHNVLKEFKRINRDIRNGEIERIEGLNVNDNILSVALQ